MRKRAGFKKNDACRLLRDDAMLDAARYAIGSVFVFFCLWP